MKVTYKRGSDKVEIVGTSGCRERVPVSVVPELSNLCWQKGISSIEVDVPSQAIDLSHANVQIEPTTNKVLITAGSSLATDRFHLQNTNVVTATAIRQLQGEIGGINNYIERDGVFDLYIPRLVKAPDQFEIAAVSESDPNWKMSISSSQIKGIQMRHLNRGQAYLNRKSRLKGKAADRPSRMYVNNKLIPATDYRYQDRTDYWKRQVGMLQSGNLEYLTDLHGNQMGTMGVAAVATLMGVIMAIITLLGSLVTAYFEKKRTKEADAQTWADNQGSTPNEQHAYGVGKDENIVGMAMMNPKSPLFWVIGGTLAFMGYMIYQKYGEKPKKAVEKK